MSANSHDRLTRYLALAGLVIPMFATPAVLASGSAEAGREKATTCEACHGKDGHSVDPNYPDLAGQYQSYLIKALSDYRAGRRQNAIMASFAGQLSNQDIEDLSAWYASLKGLRNLSEH